MAKAFGNIGTISRFHNLPPSDLAGQLGAIKAEIAELEAREKSLRDELLRRHVCEVEGALFSITVTNSVRWTLDTQAVKAEMGAAWWDRRCRQTLVNAVAVKPRATVEKLAA